MATVKEKYGVGFRFPLVPDTGFSWTYGPDIVAQALRTLLLTEPGERVGRPTYGVGLRRFLFAPNNVTTRTLVKQVVTEAIETQEARVKLDAVDVRSDSAQPTLLYIDIRYKLIDDPTPRSFVYPFYLEQGNGS